MDRAFNGSHSDAFVPTIALFPSRGRCATLVPLCLSSAFLALSVRGCNASNFQPVGEYATHHMRRALRLDQLTMIARLDAAAAVLRRLGLRPLTRVGRRALGKALDSGLQVEWEGFRIHGSIEHRGYLHALREGCHEAFETNLFKRCVEPGMKVSSRS
jgi:hypothetical protein